MRWAFYTVVFALCAGCVSKPPVVGGREYREIPEGYLQPCELPAKPPANADLSDAFVIAYLCAELGNKDKQSIRELIKSR